jgi:hypothetical protein
MLVTKRATSMAPTTEIRLVALKEAWKGSHSAHQMELPMEKVKEKTMAVSLGAMKVPVTELRLVLCLVQGRVGHSASRRVERTVKEIWKARLKAKSLARKLGVS